MTAFVKLALLGCVVFITGDAVNAACFRQRCRSPLALRVSLAYGLGTGTLALLGFYASLAGLPVTPAAIVLLALPFAVLLLCLRIKAPARGSLRKRPEKRTGMTAPAALLCLLLLAGVTLVTLRALSTPMHMPDAVAQWGLKAKIIFHERTVRASDFSDPRRLIYHARYPFLVPLLESYAYAFLGEADDRQAKLLFPGFFIALLLYLYAAQRAFAPPVRALLFTALLTMMPVFIGDGHGSPSSGYADLPLAFYYAVACISLFTWLSDRDRNGLLLAAVFMTFAAFTKKEGLLLDAIALAAACLAGLVRGSGRPGDVLRGCLLCAAVVLIALLPWFFFQNSICLPPWEAEFTAASLSPSRLSSQLGRLPLIGQSIMEVIFTPRHHNLLWILFLCAALLWIKKTVSHPRLFFVIVIVCNTAALCASALAFPFAWWTGIIHDFYRLTMVNIPLAVYFISYQLQDTAGRRAAE